MSIDVDSSYVTEDSNVETIEEVACSPEGDFDNRLLLGNLSNLRFPLKLWRIVTDCRTGAIQWIYGGTAIAIDYQIFEREYLDASKRLFKTNNITSFVRQLNLYGFRKVPKNSKTGAALPVSFSSANNSIFHHESFRAGRPDLLLHVNRRGIKPDGKKNRTSSRPRREPRRRMTVSSEQTNTTSSDTESSETESSTSAEQVIEDGIVDLDQADLIIPFGGHQEIVEEVIPLPVNEAPVHKSKRKSQHQVKQMEAKRLRVRSESAGMGQGHGHPAVHRSGSLSSSSSLHQQVAEEFIRKVRSISESKDDISNGSATNSAHEEDEIEDEEDEGIRVHSRPYVFDLKRLNGANGSGNGTVASAVAQANQSNVNRERVRVERLSRHYESPVAELIIKREEQLLHDGALDEMPSEDVMTEEVVEEEVVEEEVLEEDDSGLAAHDERRFGGGGASSQNGTASNVDDYFPDEHNTAHALLSLTCAKLQRNVAGMKTVMEPTSLTTAGLS